MSGETGPGDAAEVIRRLPGGGWLALLGGGEFSFGETVAADRAWLDRTPEGPVGFLPTASGSPDYAAEFAAYMEEVCGRECHTLPIYRHRDARRGKNLERIAEVAAVYIGAGVADQMLETLTDEPAAQALIEKLAAGGVVAAIGAAAHALGVAARELRGRDVLPGLAWLMGGVVETNFDPGHDRRLRQLLAEPGVAWGVGIPSGGALLLGPEEAVVTVGPVFLLRDADADLEALPATHPI